MVQRAAKRIPVIAGTGANSTREAIELTQLAKDAGADACLLVTPYYNKPTQEGLFQHYKAVADSVAIPIILYNVPSRTGCDLKPETVERLAAAVPSIVGIKEACSLERNREHFARVGGRMTLLSGDDDLACECVLAGYQGVVSVSANVAPRQVRNVIDAALAGNRELARKLDAQMQRLHKAMFLEIEPDPGQVGGRPPRPDPGRHPPAAGAAVEAVPRPGDGGDPVGRHRVCLTDAGQVTCAPRFPGEDFRRGGRAVEGAGLEFQLHLHRCTWVRIPPSPPATRKGPARAGLFLFGAPEVARAAPYSIENAFTALSAIALSASRSFCTSLFGT